MEQICKLCINGPVVESIDDLSIYGPSALSPQITPRAIAFWGSYYLGCLINMAATFVVELRCLVRRRAMREDKIAQYRAEASNCITRADMDTNKTSAIRWRRLAEEWLAMAEDLERRDNHGMSGN